MAICACVLRSADAQTAAAPVHEPEAVRSDSDPTSPVFVSIRPEFYRIGDGVEQRAMVFRFDAAVLQGRKLFAAGMPGLIVRVDAPVMRADVNGSSGVGVGDVYAQAFAVPYVVASRGFMVAVGSGVVLPTAMSDLLGGRKLVVAPVFAPVWRSPGRLAFIKVQNFASIAGDASRPDVNYLLVTPTFFHVVQREWWVMFDSETRTNWELNGRTGIKSGAQLGKIVGPNVGLWIKPEVWWGPNRDGVWNLKMGIVWYDRKR
jgi:hypothetical protein